MKKNNQIGQGIGALLAPKKTPNHLDQNSILVSKIIPNPNQPRKVFNEKSLKQLAQSIDEKGLISHRGKAVEKLVELLYHCSIY